MSDLKLGWLVVGCIIVAVMLFNGIKSAISNDFDSSSSAPRAPAEKTEKPAPKKPSRNYFVKTQCLAATSADDDDELIKVCNANNRDAMKLMLLSGRAVILAEGTKVFRLGGFLSYRVRILSGKYFNQVVYLPSEFLEGE